MDIRLVTTSFNDEVHGTYNEKKTGCGINLLKSENVTRYHRGGIMTDLGELTCEKCKTRIAKEMIKEDQKEMKLLLKEEKLRAKKGIVDEGIVPLGNTTAKITKDQTQKSAPAPKPAYQKPVAEAPAEPAKISATIPGTGVAIDNSLAQFAINKPQAEPEPEPVKQDNFLDQFAINKPQTEEPAPAAQPAQQDDFLAQFAVPAPAPTEPEPVQEAPQPTPAAPPVIDDISAAIAAMNTNVAPAPQPVAVEPAPVQPEPVAQPAAPQVDDILSMFSIEAPEKPEVAGTYDNDSSVIDVAEESISAVEPVAAQTPPVIDDISAAVEAAQNNVPRYEAPVQEEPAPVQTDSPSQARDAEQTSEWDLIANQLFGVQQDGVPAASAQESTPAVENVAPVAQNVPKAEVPVIEDISAAVEAVAQNVPKAEAPVIDDISTAVNAVAQNVPKAETAVKQNAPVIDDISAAVEAAAQNVPNVEAAVKQEVPVIDDISAAVNAVAQNVPKFDNVVKEEAPVIDDISSAVEAAKQNAPKAVAPVAAQSVAAAQNAPIIDDISSAVEAANQNALKTVAPAPVPVRPVPVKPVAPAAPAAPAAQQTAAPAGMPAMGQVISVPQITGYDAAKQPIYTYVQMQITGYGENGQPILSPVPGQEIPEFEMPFNKNTRLQEAIKAAQEIPTSSHEMTPGQRIAAAQAAKGSPISANVSKIATNPHSRSTSQAFINAISESKEYANQSLTDTQGLQQRTRVIGSIEDVLSQLGDNSLKQKKAIDAQVQQNIPSFQEYKAPTRSFSAQPAPSRPAPRPMPVDDRPLTKAEIKAMKKQEKIDAKFRKEMAKRGG